MYCRTRHKHKAGGGCKQTARGEKFGPGGLIPCTPGEDTRRMVVHSGAPEDADKALSCFILSIHNMEAEEAALLAPEATVSEMRKCFPHATRLDETETELLTLLKIRRQDVKGKKYKNPNKRSRT